MLKKMLKKDKILHFLLSLAIFSILNIVFPQLGVLWTSFITFLIGLAKELIYDGLLKRGTKDYYDILANVTGISFGVIAYFIFYFLK